MVDPLRIVRELSRPAAYRHSVQEVGHLRTHISFLFFAGERVYKVKRPVDLGFLDYTTLAQRERFCHEEVRLNRRLAPDVYLGVVPIVEGAGDSGLVVGGEGDAVEWAVEMVRLPSARMLDALLARGEIDNQALNDVVSLLAQFHASVPTGDGVDEHGTPAAIAANLEENFDQIRPFVAYPGSDASMPETTVISSAQAAFLRTRARGFLATERELLRRRVREGRIRDGHGDLHAGNLCFTKAGIVAYDCIEFSRRLRCGDVASELAFLAMDLDSRGYPSFARYLVKHYAEETHDPELRELIRFYKGYRAFVRGKVSALGTQDPDLSPAEREELRRTAMRYLQLAVSYELQPALILMCGLPASGKSWFAKHLSLPLRAVLLHSDVRRKTLTGLTPTTRVEESYESGLYSPEMKRRTYRSLLADAVENLEAGRSVVVDATFSRREYRASFIDAAVRLEIPYTIVHVTAPDSVVRERLAARATERSGPSDADVAVYERALETFEPPDETPGGHVLELVSGAGLPDEAISDLLDRRISTEGDG